MNPTSINHFLAAVFVAVLLTASSGLAAERPDVDRPNIIYILADDLGYGDVHALNPQRGKIATPHMDRLVNCLLYTSPSPRDLSTSRMPSSA